LGNPFIAPTVRGIENSLESRGYLTFIAETQDDQARASRIFNNLISRRVDAVITLASRMGDEAILKRAAKKVPVILGIRDVPGSGLPGVVGDDERGGRMAADHLLENGHRVLAQLLGPPDISTFEQRALAFRTRVIESGATLVPFSNYATAPTIDEGRRVMALLLAQPGPRPTAVFAHNDLLALGAVEAIQSARLSCPHDISIIGYNDSPLTDHTNPPLTTIAMPGYELGRFAAEMALSFIEDNFRPAHVLSLPPRLVPRGSVVPPSR
jgi:LacI family transcriptional regulator